MALVSSALPNLINGVSQQPANLRLPSQCDAQTNFIVTPVDSLKRRPPTKHKAKLTSDDWTNAFLHTINRDTQERYEVIVTNGDLKVFDLDGTEITVAFPNGKTYLNSSTPRTGFSLTTVADFTFVVNKSVTTAMKTTLTPTRNAEALVTVRQGNYGRDYRIFIDGTERATYTTPDGGSASDASAIDTSNIATELYNDLVAWAGTNFSFERFENAIYITNSAADFSVSIEDGFNGDALLVAKGRLQDFTDLPTKAPEGFHIEIVGDDTNAFDNYYVKFEKLDSNDSDGIWAETVAQGITYQLDETTLPHVLVRESDGTFTFRVATWEDREVGDIDSAPDPSFIGQNIENITFHRNRLGVLAGEGVIMSRAGDFFNFFPTTVTAQIDTDPIDVTGTSTVVANFKHAVPFDRDLLIWSEQAQFQMTSGNDLLTPKTVSLIETTRFQADLTAAPIGVGDNVYFCVDRGSHNGISEYFVPEDVDTNEAADVTAHVPKYIPFGVYKLTSAQNENIIVALSSGKQNSLWVYNYYWNGEQKQQSAWSEWLFDSGDTILNIDFINTELILVVARSDGAYLETIDVEAGASDESSSILMHVDRKITEANCTIAFSNGVSTITLPYPETATLALIIRATNSALSLPEGYIPQITQASSTTVTVTGDYRAAKFIIGRTYESEYQFSQIFVRERLGDGTIGISQGRLQLLRMLLQYEDTGYFKVEVTPDFRDTFSYTFSGKIVSSPQNTVGSLPIETGNYSFPILARNSGVVITIKSDSPLPLRIASAEWQGNFIIRSRRV